MRLRATSARLGSLTDCSEGSRVVWPRYLWLAGASAGWQIGLVLRLALCCALGSQRAVLSSHMCARMRTFAPRVALLPLAPQIKQCASDAPPPSVRALVALAGCERLGPAHLRCAGRSHCGDSIATSGPLVAVDIRGGGAVGRLAL